MYIINLYVGSGNHDRPTDKITSQQTDIKLQWEVKL